MATKKKARRSLIPKIKLVPMWLPTGTWWKRYWPAPVIAILVIAIICLSVFLPRQKVEVPVEVPADTTALEAEKTALSAENVALKADKAALSAENTGLKTDKTLLEGQLASLNDQLGGIEQLELEITRLQKELEAASKAVISVPAVPGQSELVSWTDTEAKSLMRTLYPGTDKYRDPAFDSTMVYPLSWYQSILPVLPENDWPAGLVAWFSVRYPGIATGYAWVDKGEWSLAQIVPAHVNGTIDLYYLVDKTWVRASGNQDITPFVKAVNLLN
jgi:Na+-transporting methylmalonyl-CoA/oxaloacetate decarboxylase gamma subunit